VLDDAVPVPRSSGTIALHVGIAALPDVGPAKKQFALCTPKAANICEAVATVAAVGEVAYWMPVGVKVAPLLPPPQPVTSTQYFGVVSFTAALPTTE